MNSKFYAREAVQKSFESLHSRMMEKNPDSQLTHSNQREAAMEIVQKFRSGASAVTLLALPQVGKTGAMLYVAYLMATLINDDEMIHYDNVFVISGMNDTDWQEQTASNFPEIMRKNILTRSMFHKKFKEPEDLKKLRNALIIIDECHIAAEYGQQLPTVLFHGELNTPQFLDKKHVKILQVSATPAHTLFNAINKWGDKHATVCLEAGPSYVGFKQILDSGRVVDNTYEPGVNNMVLVEDDIKEIYTSPKYHICRLGPKDREAFNAMIKRNHWEKKTHDSKSREDTDVLFESPPSVHTFILIKGFWRAGKRLNDKHIGIMYEFPSDKPDCNVVTQSLAGRSCGNGKQKPGGESPIIYCHEKSIRNYVEWFENDGSFDSEYISRHLVIDKHGNILSKSSMHSEDGFKKKNTDYAIAEPTFDSRESAKVWTIQNLSYGSTNYDTYGPDTEDGERTPGTTHIRYRGKTVPFLTEEEARASTLINIGANSAARVMPVISDIGQGANTSARIMPVMNEVVKYIVIYKKEFRKNQELLV
jgi:hypothetical protein